MQPVPVGCVPKVHQSKKHSLVVVSKLSSETPPTDRLLLFLLSCSLVVPSHTVSVLYRNYECKTHHQRRESPRSPLTTMSQAPSSPAQQADDYKEERVVIATRIHLGKATAPPTNLERMIRSFWEFAQGYINAIPVIAVEAENRIPGYNLLSEIKSIVESLEKEDIHNNAAAAAAAATKIHLVPVQPWNHFTPALNALVQFAQQQEATSLLFCSAETNAPAETTIPLLLSHLQKGDTLVVGAVLPGHEFHSAAEKATCTTTAAAARPTEIGATNSPPTSFTVVPLTGRTCPWNTLALWNVPLLSRTGFPLVADTPGIAGIEEVATVALQQQMWGGRTRARAKLIPVPGVTWATDFTDPSRQAWHQQKMESKNTRAAAQLQLLGINAAGHDGTAVFGVEHHHHHE